MIAHRWRAREIVLVVLLALVLGWLSYSQFSAPGPEKVAQRFLRDAARLADTQPDLSLLLTVAALQAADQPAPYYPLLRSRFNEFGVRKLDKFETSPEPLWTLIHSSNSVAAVSTEKSVPLSVAPEEILSHAFSADGRYLIVGLRDSGAQLWDLHADGKPAFLKHPATVGAISFHPRSDLIATATWQGEVTLWSPGKAQPLHTFQAHQGAVRALEFSADGGRLASAGSDGQVKIWSSDDRSLVKTLSGHTSAVWCLAFSPDGTQLASGSVDRSVHQWTLEGDSLPVVRRRHLSPVVRLKLSDDGSLISEELGGAIYAWSPPTLDGETILTRFKEVMERDFHHGEIALYHLDEWAALVVAKGGRPFSLAALLDLLNEQAWVAFEQYNYPIKPFRNYRYNERALPTEGSTALFPYWGDEQNNSLSQLVPAARAVAEHTPENQNANLLLALAATLEGDRQKASAAVSRLKAAGTFNFVLNIVDFQSTDRNAPFEWSRVAQSLTKAQNGQEQTLAEEMIALAVENVSSKDLDDKNLSFLLAMAAAQSGDRDTLGLHLSRLDNLQQHYQVLTVLDTGLKRDRTPQKASLLALALEQTYKKSETDPDSSPTGIGTVARNLLIKNPPALLESPEVHRLIPRILKASPWIISEKGFPMEIAISAVEESALLTPEQRRKLYRELGTNLSTGKRTESRLPIEPLWNNLRNETPESPAEYLAAGILAQQLEFPAPDKYGEHYRRSKDGLSLTIPGTQKDPFQILFSLENQEAQIALLQLSWQPGGRRELDLSPLKAVADLDSLRFRSVAVRQLPSSSQQSGFEARLWSKSVYQDTLKLQTEEEF